MTDTEGVPMLSTIINRRWELLLPEHRHGRLEWDVWEQERLGAMFEFMHTAPGYGPVPSEPGDPRGALAPRHRVFDIGAEEGDFPALWASWGATVTLVEPNPKVWPNIRAIFEANGLVDRVDGYFVGFAGEEELANHKWDRDHVATVSGDGRVVHGAWPQCAYGPIIGDHGFLVLPERPDVPIVTIDALALTSGPPSCITIDVEGAELTVLRGARHVLATSQPRIFVSVHLDLPWIDEKYPGDTGEKVAEFLHGFGYEGRHLATDHEEHWEWRHPEGH